MGKCKRRNLYKADLRTTCFMTREKAVNDIFKTITGKVRVKDSFKHALKTISLFGISAEELSEAGVPYENLLALQNVLS